MEPPRSSQSARGALLGLGAAALFGASAPVAKLLLPGAGPLLLAALLYVGAGLALSVARSARRIARRLAPDAEPRRETPLRRADRGLLLAILVTGGVLGPVLMLIGIARLSAVAGSLLLGMEAPLTIVVAVVLFHEHLGRRVALAAAFVVAGATVLGLGPGDLRADLVGVVAITGACLAWGVDNNLTQRLTLRDPIAVVRMKTLGAGAFNLVLALALGHRLPGPGLVAAALALGALSYGVSVVLDMHALRLLGAAREAAYFATAPFVGAALAVPLHGRWPTAADVVAAACMVAGVVLLVRERHSHPHSHDAIEHEHGHVHDEHHQHAHDGPFTEPHAHVHRHQAITHDHPHLPDLHHRHGH